ncbi:MAG: phosphorylase [Cyanobacteria bacterium P01_G01_bin.19]
MFIDTIVVPQGAEYQAVCRGLNRAGCNCMEVIAIPIGTRNIQQILSDRSSELSRAKNILILGLCGSLNPEYKVGDIVLYQNCWNLKHQSVSLNSKLNAEIEQKISVSLVDGLTSDRLVCQAEEKLKLSQTYPGNVVDMEGYDYTKELQKRNISVAMLRVVSDDVTGNIPDLTKAVDPKGNLQPIPMAIAFLKQPVAAVRLIQGSLTGLNKLREITEKLFYR